MVLIIDWRELWSFIAKAKNKNKTKKIENISRKLKFDEEPRLFTLQEMFSILSNTKIQCPVIKKVFSPDFEITW